MKCSNQKKPTYFLSGFDQWKWYHCVVSLCFGLHFRTIFFFFFKFCTNLEYVIINVFIRLLHQLPATRIWHFWQLLELPSIEVLKTVQRYLWCHVFIKLIGPWLMRRRQLIHWKHSPSVFTSTENICPFWTVFFPFFKKLKPELNHSWLRGFLCLICYTLLTINKVIRKLPW